MLLIEEFPHHSDHLANDENQAYLTMFLLSMFVVTLCIAAIAVVL